MNKDVLIAGGIVLICILSIVIAFCIPIKHKMLHDKQIKEENNYQGMHYEIKYSDKAESDGKFTFYIIDYDNKVKHKITLDKQVNIYSELGIKSND